MTAFNCHSCQIRDNISENRFCCWNFLLHFEWHKKFTYWWCCWFMAQLQLFYINKVLFVGKWTYPKFFAESLNAFCTCETKSNECVRTLLSTIAALTHTHTSQIHRWTPKKYRCVFGRIRMCAVVYGHTTLISRCVFFVFFFCHCRHFVLLASAIETSIVSAQSKQLVFVSFQQLIAFPSYPTILRLISGSADLQFGTHNPCAVAVCRQVQIAEARKLQEKKETPNLGEIQSCLCISLL